MEFFDLFAGIGGFRLGMEKAGHTCVGTCEWDKYPREIYKERFNKYTEWSDATKINASELPDFDCLCAGFPCQPFSIAGKRGGFIDTRGTLFFDIIRIAKEKRPRYLFLENVKGLLNHDKGSTFGTILNALDEVGYDAEWQLFDGKHYLPQHRERIIIIGHLRGGGGRKILPIRETGQSDGKTNEGESNEGTRIQTEICSTIDTRYNQGRHSGETYLVVPLTETRTEEAKKIRKELEAQGKNNSRRDKIIVPRKEGIPGTLTANESIERFLIQVGSFYENSHAGRVYDPKGIARGLLSGEGGMGKQTGLYKIGFVGTDSQGNRIYSTKGSAATIGSTSGGTGSHTGLYGIETDEGDFRIRKLTPTECERIMGFPDGWTIFPPGFTKSENPRYFALGNAIMVPMVYSIARLFK